jgi:hypothetical protein
VYPAAVVGCPYGMWPVRRQAEDAVRDRPEPVVVGGNKAEQTGSEPAAPAGRPSAGRLRPIVGVLTGGALVAAAVVISVERTLWDEWLSGRSVTQYEMLGWPMQSWGRVGKLLQFVAGLTVLLDLAGRRRITMGHRWAHAQTARTLDQVRTLLPRVVQPWKAWYGRVAWVGFPLWGICNGVIYFYLQTEVMEFPNEFALWGSLAAAVLSVVVMIPRSFVVGLALYGLPLAGYGIIGYIRFGFPDFTRLPLWKLALLDNGQWIWVSVAAAVLFYSMTMVTLLLGILLIRLIASLSLMAAIAPLMWALAKEAHPLRLLAFVLFVLGFHLDLLAS